MSAARVENGGRRLPDPKVCQRLAEQMLALALKAGADGAEVLVRDGTELEVKVRLGETELIKEAGSRALGLRVLKDGRSAVTYTSDFVPAAMERFARESVELAALAEPDPAGELPAKEEMARELAELDLWDDAVLSLDVSEGLRRARLGEAAALKLDKRITNSDGAVFGRSVGASAFATSAGFSGSARGTHVSFAVEPICDDADGKKRNGVYWSAARFAAGLGDPEAIGLEAARRTLAKLGARKIPTGAAPVVFSPEAGRGLVGQLAGVLSGGALWRRSTYLAGREGTAVASPLVELVDDPLIRRAPRLAPLRRRRAAEPDQRAHLGRPAAHLPLRRLRRPQARAPLDRIGHPRGRRRPPGGHLQPDPARRPHAGRRDRAPRPRPLRHRSDGLRLQRRDRRLLARRGRLLDRARRARLPGHRDHRFARLRRSLEAGRRRRRRSRHAHVGAVPDFPCVRDDDRRQLSRPGPASDVGHPHERRERLDHERVQRAVGGHDAAPVVEILAIVDERVAVDVGHLAARGGEDRLGAAGVPDLGPTARVDVEIALRLGDEADLETDAADVHLVLDLQRLLDPIDPLRPVRLGGDQPDAGRPLDGRGVERDARS